MERKDRIRTAYEYLKNIGKVSTQQDIADSMEIKKESLSRALNGNESYLTDKFIRRFNQTYDNIFNMKWLLNEEGDMMAPTQSVGDITNSSVSGVNVNGQEIHINPDAYNTLLKIVEANQKSTEKFQNQIDRLISIIETKDGTKNW